MGPILGLLTIDKKRNLKLGLFSDKFFFVPNSEYLGMQQGTSQKIYWAISCATNYLNGEKFKKVRDKVGSN